MVDAKVEALVLVTGSRIPKEHIPQQPMRQEVKSSKPECAPAEYASTCNTRNKALIEKLYTNLDNFPFVGLVRAHPGHAMQRTSF